MISVTAALLYKYPAELGEGALWDMRTNRLLWVDITAGNLHRFDPETGVNETFSIGTSVGTVVPMKEDQCVLAVREGFMTYDMSTGVAMMIKKVTHNNPSVRFNDGKCDPYGRLWAGTLAEDGTKDVGVLYCLEPNLSIIEKRASVGISNGIGWSPDLQTMYYIDSLSQTVVSYDYDGASGAISDPQIVLTIDPEEGTPDGMCVDSEGMLFIALWDGGKVIRSNPHTGERLMEVIVPGVRKVSSCALGGEDMTTLFITTARQGFTEEDAKEQPNAGSLFSVHVGVRGLPTLSFNGNFL